MFHIITQCGVLSCSDISCLCNLYNDCSPDDLALPAVRSVEWPHDEDGEGEDEAEGGEEHVGEVGDWEDGHGVNVQGVEDPGPGHQDSHQGQAGVEDEERGQGV